MVPCQLRYGTEPTVSGITGNTIEQYTTLVPLPQRQAQSVGSENALGVPGTIVEPSRVELLAAIQGSRVALEGKTETVAVEVKLLLADHRKVSEKVKVVEGSIVELQAEVGSLRKQMMQVNSKVGRKGFMEVKAKLHAMNVRYMLLYPARQKVISRGKSHFLDRPEEVWRWLEIWDKAAPGRMERTGLTVHCPSGPASPDWRSCRERQWEGTADQVVDMTATTRVEIQQDGTMAVVTPRSTDGSKGTMVLGAEVLTVDT
ncbi:hypothetical protein NDU88_004855 [Pleurodeles waltl]|uniref:Uncharacterized protein n=1 Tax=Pleurodeles waltl TaxID=8319 RepID=A0AAV7WA48_PLEWA|nr:hypothetical protein NDU88_004855 [Pleurodeles waltl]